MCGWWMSCHKLWLAVEGLILVLEFSIYDVVSSYCLFKKSSRERVNLWRQPREREMLCVKRYLRYGIIGAHCMLKIE
jgi:hypothetical protein